MTRTLSVGDRRLRLSVLFACGVEAAFIVFLAVFLLKQADPLGDDGNGFCWLCVHADLFAIHIARAHSCAKWWWLVLATGLAALGAFAYFGSWLEILSELGLPKIRRTGGTVAVGFQNP